ncbi:hypothetical protein SteCoe_22305 [Stentor coeruleus]|uniref:Oxysterol-binding protein n=1 Tax=Stentor coeruleus TaxID=5963 RepID=A0A1R2BMQ2_9CILI|nr:hypothetical protein SteCoe_22305 [Stentor coeruleus]
MEQDDPCTIPRDGNNLLIWSNEISSGPFSLLINSDYDTESPPPTYLSINYLNRERPTDKNSQLNGYIQLPEGGLQCIDERILGNQSGIIFETISKVAVFLAKGKSVVGMSLPIKLFEPRSTLERMLDRWAFMPVFMRSMSGMDNVEKFKKVITMAVAGLYIAPSQEKPFNPLLGETLQAYWPDGTQAYCEHTVYHPPVTNFCIYAKDFTIDGHLELTGKFKKNSFIGGYKGKVRVKFNSGQIVSYTFPQFRAGGMVFGPRTVNWERVMLFEDNSGLTAMIKLGPKRKKTWFKKAIGKNDDFKGEIEQSGTKVCEITGSWLEGLSFNGIQAWDINRDLPVFHKFTINPLPSDWRYREDLIWLSKGYPEIAQIWKYKIEYQQRKNRKLRTLGLKHK